MRQYSTSAGLYRGLLYNLVKTGKRESINLTATETYSNYQDRVIDNIIDYDNENMYTSLYDENFGQWVQIELVDRFIDLKAYALGLNGRNYPRHWDVFVSMDGNHWNNPHQIRNNDDSHNGHIFKFTKHIGFIRFFKIINKGFNAENDRVHNQLYISNIDLYGNVVECDNNCTVFPHISITNRHCKKYGINFIYVATFTLFVS
jgi:hypothetical protein